MGRPKALVPAGATPVEAVLVEVPDGLMVHGARFLTWLQVVRGRSENTITGYGRDLSAFLAFTASRGLDRPEQITVRVIEGYMATLRHRRGLAPSSCNRALYAIREFWKYLVREGLAPKNTAALVNGVTVRRPMPKYLTVPEQEKVLATLAADRSRLGIRDCALVALMLGTGLRVSEVTMLDAADLSVPEGTVRVRHAKGGDWRHVPLPEAIVPALEAYLPVRAASPAARMGMPKFFVPLRRPSWAIGAPADQQVLERRSIREILRRKLSPLVGKHVHPHMLRHSFASRLREHGAPLELISEMLGHRQLATTMIYAHLTSAKQRQELSQYWSAEA